MSMIAAFRPTLRLAANVNNSVAVPASKSAANKLVGGVVTLGCVSAVVGYIGSQLRRESNVMDRMFEKQNTPEVIRRRNERLLVDTEGDPRKSLFNILNWR